MITTTKPRPTKRDPEIIQAVAEKLAPQVIEWMNESGPHDLAEIIHDLKKALRWEEDGYKLAKELDDYEPDAQLVEILDSAGHLLYTEVANACERWITEEDITAPEIGTKVTSDRHPEAGTGIIKRNGKDGRSTVCFQDIGHVLEGSGTGGFILAWETLKPAP